MSQDSNVYSIATKEAFIDQRAEQVKWLREIADGLEQMPVEAAASIQTAIAFFVHTDADNSVLVRVSGFADDRSATKYFLSFIRQNGFK